MHATYTSAFTVFTNTHDNLYLKQTPAGAALKPTPNQNKHTNYITIGKQFATKILLVARINNASCGNTNNCSCY